MASPDRKCHNTRRPSGTIPGSAGGAFWWGQPLSDSRRTGSGQETWETTSIDAVSVEKGRDLSEPVGGRTYFSPLLPSSSSPCLG